jgi:hypothetical protein
MAGPNAVAGVEPQFETLPEDMDVVAFIISINIKHRFLTKGQQAIAEAILHPEDGGKGGRGKRVNLPQNGNFGRERLRQARAVLRHSRSLAESVLKGITPLNDALATIKQEQQYQSSDEAKLARLQKSAPDLADQVNEERLKISKAIVLAMMYPESENGGRGKKSAAKNLLVSSGFSRQRLDQARTILHHSRPLAESVLKGITKFTGGYWTRAFFLPGTGGSARPCRIRASSCCILFAGGNNFSRSYS